MNRFEYIRPDNLADTFAGLRDNPNPWLLAGGTDLLIEMKSNALKPGCIIDLKNLPGMSAIEYGDGIKIGALATIRDIEVSPVIREKVPVLSEAAATLGSIQIRNRATLGGNLCHGSPAADMAAVLLAMDSEVTIAGPHKAKTMAMAEFFTGPNQTALKDNELLTGITIPREIEQFKGVYLKLGPRKAMDIGIVNIAVLMDADKNTRLCRRIMIAMGAVAPTPIRADQAEAMLKDNTLTPELIHEAAEAAAAEARPITDFRASAQYRKRMVSNLVARAIEQILDADNA